MSRADESGSRPWGVSLGARTVRAFGIVFIVVGLALPLVVRWRGRLEGEVPAGSARGPRTVRPVMMRLPAGRFAMGSPEGEADRNEDEGPVHDVELDEG